jgi:hypothetical protein
MNILPQQFSELFAILPLKLHFCQLYAANPGILSSTLITKEYCHHHAPEA